MNLLRQLLKYLPTLVLSLVLAIAVWISAVTSIDPVVEKTYPRAGRDRNHRPEPGDDRHLGGFQAVNLADQRAAVDLGQAGRTTRFPCGASSTFRGWGPARTPCRFRCRLASRRCVLSPNLP